MYSSLQNEIPYSEIFQEVLGGTRQVEKNNLFFLHDQSQDVDLDFWRIVVPGNFEIKEQIVREIHSTPYSAHPGIQVTIAKVSKYF